MTEKEACNTGNYDDILECVSEEEVEEGETDFITLEFDDGVEVECEIMGVFDCEEKDSISFVRRVTRKYTEPNKKTIPTVNFDLSLIITSNKPNQKTNHDLS